MVMWMAVACNPPARKISPPEVQQEQIPEVSVFPVTAFLKGQLKEIESSPVTLLKITQNGDRPDSAWVEREVLREFVEPFVATQVDSANSYNWFSANSFYDNDEDGYVLEYNVLAGAPDSMPVQRFLIYIDAGENQVSGVFMEVVQKGVEKQLIWKTKGVCTIYTMETGANDTIEPRGVKFVWTF